MNKKKRCKKAQLSMEYVIIFAFIMIIIIPTIYLLKNYIAESSDTITISKAERISRVLIDNGREMYYSGSPAKVVVTVDMPQQVDAIWVMDNKTTNEYALVFRINTVSGNQTLFYDSDIPIQCWKNPAELCVENKELNFQCLTNEFKCFEFPERDRTQGVKRFKLEAYDQCIKDDDTLFNCVRVDEVSNII